MLKDPAALDQDNDIQSEQRVFEAFGPVISPKVRQSLVAVSLQILFRRRGGYLWGFHSEAHNPSDPDSLVEKERYLSVSLMTSLAVSL